MVSNIAYWLQEFKFDGFRFDGITSMLYTHHGLGFGFSGGYHEYYGQSVDEDAVAYLMLTVKIAKTINPNCVLIAEDVSGMPLLARPQEDGGIGFDYRLAMAIPDKWIKLLKEKTDDQWEINDIVHTLTNRRWKEKCIAYTESHDQAIVGDKTIAMWLFDRDIYDEMGKNQPETLVVNRGIALHKMIRLLTLTLGGEGYLTFMGNEFGHPEWIDFPREGNGWSYTHCRRQWNLADDDNLRYQFLGNWDREMIQLDNQYEILCAEHQYVSTKNESDKVIVCERGNLLFVFNFHPCESFVNYKIGTPWNAKHRIILNTDKADFGGHSRVDDSLTYDVQQSEFNGRPYSLYLYLPNRSAIVLKAE